MLERGEVGVAAPEPDGVVEGGREVGREVGHAPDARVGRLQQVGAYPHQPPSESNMPGPVPGGSMTTCSWVSQNWPSVPA